MTNTKALLSKIVSYVLAISGAVIILLPFYVTLITAFKTPQESAQSFFSFPKSLYLENFKTVFAKAGYFKYFMNSVIVTVSSLVLIYILVTMISYAVARNMKQHVYYKFIFGLLYLECLFRSKLSWFPLYSLWADWDYPINLD